MKEVVYNLSAPLSYHSQPMRKKPPQNTTKLPLALFRLFALERFSRKLRSLSTPTSCQLECDDFLEIMQFLKHLLQG
jgi:transcriptional regulator of met regulon